VKNDKGQIKIGPQTFAIVVKEDLRQGDESLDGWIKFSESTIYLDARLDTFSHRQVLWHEVIHAIVNMAGIKDVKEEAIDAISFGIMDVLQDNPWINE
jgi:hypothetical protein